MNGLQGDLNAQLRMNKGVGVSSALSRAKARPEGNYHGNAVRNNIQFNPCEKCGQQAEFSSVVNGELEYCLCRECFAKRK